MFNKDMKKFLISVCSLFAAVAVVSAQDVNQATDFYNNAVSYYSNGNLASAIESFKKAHEIAKQCGDDGAEIVVDCETYIPKLGMDLAKDMVAEGNYEGGVAKLSEIAALCESMGLTDEVEKINKMKPQFYMQQGNKAVKAKDYAGAVKAFDNVLALDPANGKAALLKGQILLSTNNVDAAKAALELAAKNGQEKAANRQLANLYVKQAKAASGAKNYAKALECANQAISYDPTEANAYYLGGIAAQALKKNTEAISLFENYLVLKPAASNSQAVRQVVEALKKGNKPAEAED